MIFFLIPLYNEAENIPNLFNELDNLRLEENSFYVFSDDGSTDDSRKIIHALFKGKPYTILGDEVNRGPGAAFNSGFSWIINQSTSLNDIVVTLEADCTSDLSILPEMLMLCKMKYDLILASVYAQGGGFESTNIGRRFISSVANFLYRFFFNVKTLTLSSFYRVYRITLLQKLQQTYGMEIIKEKGFVSMLEILLKSIESGCLVIEVPMKLHSSKRIGKSKMKVIRTTLKYFNFLLRIKLGRF